jgi:hypothetical protein
MVDVLKTIELQSLKLAYCTNADAPPAGADVTAPVVLLHGWGCSIQTMEPI